MIVRNSFSDNELQLALCLNAGMMNSSQRIISGGQIGADHRGTLDFAIAHGIEDGGIYLDPPNLVLSLCRVTLAPLRMKWT
jgi:hypothetical protein